VNDEPVQSSQVVILEKDTQCVSGSNEDYIEFVSVVKNLVCAIENLEKRIRLLEEK